MALKLWLPLNDNLRNIGLHKVSVVNNGATLYNNGLFGKCYSFVPGQYIELTNVPFSELNNCSVSFWIKLDANEVEWLLLSGQGEAYYLLAWRSESYNNGDFYHMGVGTVHKIYVDGVEGTKPIRDGNWHHYCAVGVNFSTWTKLYINRYASTGNVYNFTGLLTDFRIYDHRITYQDVQRIYQNKEIIVLPYEYEELEYIEGTGTQWIDCGVIGSQNTSAEVNVELLSTEGYPAVFGSRSSMSSRAFNIWMNTGNGYVGANYCNGGQINSTIQPSVNTIYKIKLEKNKLTVNNSVKTFTQNTDFTTPGNIYLFNIQGGSTTSTGNSSNRILVGKVYYFIIKESDVYVRKFIPARRKFDNVIGMYDLVSKKFFTNQGTGAFNAGPSVISLPKEYEKLEYIEGTGTQWIDTEYLVNSSNISKLKYKLDGIATNTAVGNKWWANGIGGGSGIGFYVGLGNGNSSPLPFTYGRGVSDTVTSVNGSLGVRYKWELDMEKQTYKVWSNDGDLLVSTTFTRQTPTEQKTLPLFRWRRYNDQGGYIFGMKIYSMQLFDDSILVRDMVPSKRKSDNVIGMYDMVSGKFFTNSGTGSFTGA